MSLMETLLKTTTIKDSSLVSESKLFNATDIISVEVPIINVAFSGDIDGGLKSAITFIYGDSKNFKSLLGLMIVKAFLKKYDDGVVIFYDSEKGITPEYLTSLDINASRMIHCPVTDIEELKFDMVKKLGEIKFGDKVLFFIDSIGNLASKKELEDAENEKSVNDMTRAKSLKSFWRIVTPSISFKNIFCVAINHGYETMDLFPQKVMSGGKGNILASNQILNISKSKEKDGAELVGFKFNITVDKSRFVREGSKIPFVVNFNSGINKWAGFLESALEYGIIIKPSNGYYQRMDLESGEIIGNKIREKETYTEAFMKPILENPGFKEFIVNKYKLAKLSISESE